MARHAIKPSNLCTGCAKRSAGDWCPPCALLQAARDAALSEQLTANGSLRPSIVGRAVTRTWLLLGGVLARPEVLEVPALLTAAAVAVPQVTVQQVKAPTFYARAARISDRAWAAHLRAKATPAAQLPLALARETSSGGTSPTASA
jgi:hypothetical protein